MRFGVNYVPSVNWFYSWADFDEAAVRRDLEAIRALGFDHIRAHLLWSYFQPNPGFFRRWRCGILTALCGSVKKRSWTFSCRCSPGT